MSNQTDKQRRKFLKQFGLLAGGTTLLAAQSKLQFIKTALAANYNGINDQKSLVCIFLAGGNDGFNMFAPYQSDLHQAYSNIRKTLAISRADLAGQQVEDGSGYAFHPKMKKIAEIYNQGKLALISNVGNLGQPLTQAQYLSGNSGILIPESLFSHNHQQETWQTNRAPAQPTPAGWGGLLADLLKQANTGSQLAPTFSLSGTSPWQSGITTQPFSLNSSGVNDFEYLQSDLPNGTDRHSIRSKIWSDMLALNRNHVLEQHSARSLIETKERLVFLQDALNTPVATNFDDSAFDGLERNRLANNLKMIARLISARDAMSQKRQIFFVRFGSWDTHSDQLNQHTALLTQLNDAMSAFQTTMNNAGNIDENSVTTFTASEFGRTATSNGDGTDHGWGGHQLVMGGAVNGGQIHGILPDITPGGINDSDTSANSAGRIIPTIAVDQYGATLAKWMGVVDSDLNAIFPNLTRFSQRDLGFMN